MKSAFRPDATDDHGFFVGNAHDLCEFIHFCINGSELQVHYRWPVEKGSQQSNGQASLDRPRFAATGPGDGRPSAHPAGDPRARRHDFGVARNTA